ncbi:MAG: hypothetical protein C4532_09045 [Candidatus Abyssobacteria bacterium SURF_17]|uniref:Aminoglycoside phosphotransferase domain-containing protein n=1 Tax=Candidatus Abyssobacteria bacterium SURF_17 TaxID=2093361 RepID=A0A419EZ18_9BACT|nr:MAG: hypothetical protein C4532_09045 [Candidatus Abyssubacteria bacterium SURF_17]
MDGYEGRTAMSFVFKVYHYSLIAGISTVRQMSKAEQEFRGLHQCQNLGVPAAQPVGFGTLSGRCGMHRSCFVMTRFVENAIDFRNWLNEKDKWRITGRQSKATIMEQLGVHLRRLHEERFFLMRPSPKNILICDAGTTQPKPMFIDLAYARFFTSELLARHAQRIDLGRLFGPLLRRREYDLLDSFLGTYLPDPFGRTCEDLRRLIVRAARVQSNRTPFSWVSNRIQRTSIRRIRRAVRKGIRMLIDEEYREEKRKKARGKRFPDG